MKLILLANCQAKQRSFCAQNEAHLACYCQAKQSSFCAQNETHFALTRTIEFSVQAFEIFMLSSFLFYQKNFSYNFVSQKTSASSSLFYAALSWSWEPRRGGSNGWPGSQSIRALAMLGKIFRMSLDLWFCFYLYSLSSTGDIYCIPSHFSPETSDSLQDLLDLRNLLYLCNCLVAETSHNHVLIFLPTPQEQTPEKY